MKDIITKHKVVFLLIAILVVAFIMVRIGDAVITTVVPSASSTPTSTVDTGTKTNAPTTTISNNATKPVAVTGTSLKMTLSKEANYDAYMQQLGVNESKCKNLTESLYNRLYGGTLESVTYSSSYYEDTGQCYMDVVGKKRTFNSFNEVVKITQHFYFRNVLTTNLLAECSKEGDSTVTNQNQYVCTDKVTGKAISKTQYDNLLASYK